LKLKNFCTSLQLHFGETQLRLRLLEARLGKRNGNLLVARSELEQEITLLHELPGVEVDFEQEAVETWPLPLGAPEQACLCIRVFRKLLPAARALAQLRNRRSGTRR
jgi:hypothetical protein